MNKRFRSLFALCVLPLWAHASGCGGTQPYVPAGPATVLQLQPDKPASRFHVQLKSADGSQHTCDAPCELSVPSGTSVAHVSGAAAYTQTLVVPAEGALGRLEQSRPTQALVGLGVMATSGVVMLGAGLAAGISSVLACPEGRWNSVASVCQIQPGDVLTPDQMAHSDRAFTSAIVTLGAVGGVLLGALLIATSGKDQIHVESRARTLALHRPAVRWRGLDIIPLTASSTPVGNRGDGVLALAKFSLR